jgi:ATP-dependent DNA ligase
MRRVAGTSGKGSVKIKEGIIAKLVGEATGEEAKYIIRFL